MAWRDAMLEFGHDVSFEQARSQIGKGGDKLIRAGPGNLHRMISGISA
jgi:hypothetical protein